MNQDLNNFIITGEKIFLQEKTSNLIKGIEPGYYKVQVHHISGPYLIRAKDPSSPKELLSLDEEFIHRVISSWNKNERNLGVLLCGMSGTGKTVHSKIICERLSDFPVLILEKIDKETINLVSKINQEIIILIDEFEKVFDEIDGELIPLFLSLMDGLQDQKSKKLFLLTSNRSVVYEYLMNRPGRIRYKKEFGSLSRSQVIDIASNKLENKNYLGDLISTCESLEKNSIDALLSIIEESNSEGISPSEALKFLNLQRKDKKVYFYFLIDGKWEKMNIWLKNKKSKELTGEYLKESLDDSFEYEYSGMDSANRIRFYLSKKNSQTKDHYTIYVSLVNERDNGNKSFNGLRLSDIVENEFYEIKIEEHEERDRIQIDVSYLI